MQDSPSSSPSSSDCFKVGRGNNYFWASFTFIKDQVWLGNSTTACIREKWTHAISGQPTFDIIRGLLLNLSEVEINRSIDKRYLVECSLKLD